MAHNVNSSPNLVLWEYKHICESAAVGIARLAPDGRWLETNKCLCSMLGYTQEERLATTCRDITFPDDPPHGSQHAGAQHLVSPCE